MALILSFVLVSAAGCRTTSAEPDGDPATLSDVSGPEGAAVSEDTAVPDDAAAPDEAAAPGTLRVDAPTSTGSTTTTAVSTTEATVETSESATTSIASTTASTEPTTTAAVSTTAAPTTALSTTVTALSTTRATATTPTTTTPTATTPTTSATTSTVSGAHPDIVKIISVRGRNPGGDGWKDSYSVGQKCYCATTFDHNIGPIEGDTPAGKKTVREVCEKIGDGPGPQGRPIYNDIQCGNGPANDAGDEDDCPGRVDIGRGGCGHIGPKWDLTVFQ